MQLHIRSGFLILLFITGSFSSAFSQWVWKNPLPQGNHLRAAWFNDPESGFIVGDVGTILKTTDGGETWDVKNLIEYTKWTFFNSICFPDENTGYAASGSLVYKTTNAGISWDTVYYEDEEDVNDLYFVDSLTGFLVCSGGKILKTTDGGINWQYQIYPAEEDFTAVCFPAFDTGYISGYSGSILKTNDCGNTWVTVCADSLWFTNLEFSSPGKGFALTYYDTILITRDGGLTWQQTVFGDSVHIISIGIFDDNNIILGTEIYADWPYYYLLKKSTDGGISWSNIPIPAEYSLQSIFCTSEGTAYMVGYYGFIARSDDFGVTWTQLNSVLTELNHFGANTREIDFPTIETGYAVAGGYENPIGTILKTIDGGNSWFQLDSSFNSVTFKTLKFFNADTGIIAGTNIYKTYDGGETWTMKFAGYHDMATSLGFASPSIGIMVGYDSSFLRTTDSGEHWEQLGDIPDPPYYNVCFADEARGFVSSYNRLLRTLDSGVSWIEIPTSFSLRDMDFPTNQIGFGVGFDGLLMKTADGGLSWSQLSPPSDDDFTSVEFYDQDTGFICGGYGVAGIYKTTDGGQSWIKQVVPTITYIGNVCVKSDYKVFATDADGGLFANMNPGIVTSTLNIPFKEANLNLLAYPNPSSGTINIEYTLSEEALIRMKLYSINGIEIKTLEETVKLPGEYKLGVSTAGLRKGVYILKVCYGNYSEVKKILVM